MFTEGSGDALMNGTTEVTVVPAPRDSMRRIVRLVNFFNDDTGGVTVQLYLKNGATLRQLREAALGSKATAEYPSNGGVYVLDSTTKSLVAKLTGAPAANQPIVTAHWGDSS